MCTVSSALKEGPPHEMIRRAEQTEMKENRKDRLIELGSEALAEALLELESRNDAVHEVVERMLATPNENIKRFKTKLARLKRGRRFVSWREVADLAHR